MIELTEGFKIGPSLFLKKSEGWTRALAEQVLEFYGAGYKKGLLDGEMLASARSRRSR